MHAGKGRCKGYNVRNYIPTTESDQRTFFVKAWMKFLNIVLLGDNLLQDRNVQISYEGNKMAKIFEPYKMRNIIEGPTRITNHSKIDPMVTTRKDLVKQKGTCPLVISDPDRIYAILATSVPRDPPKIITIRNYRKFDEREFQTDIDRAPFQVFEVYEDPADAYHTWNVLFTEICDKHASFKQIKMH